MLYYLYGLTNIIILVIKANSQGIDCCSADGSDFLAPGSRHPQCFPIEIPADDKFYGKVRQRCMNFVRTMPGPSHECNFGHAEQVIIY